MRLNKVVLIPSLTRVRATRFLSAQRLRIVRSHRSCVTDRNRKINSTIVLTIDRNDKLSRVWAPLKMRQSRSSDYVERNNYGSF